MRSTALLALRLRGFRNRFVARKGETIGFGAMMLVLALAWCLAIVGGTAVALSGALESAAAAPDARALLETIAITLVASAIMVLGLLVDNGTAASLLTPDVDRLLIAPVPTRAIVRAKIVANLPLSALILAPGTIAVAAVVGDASGRWGAALALALVTCVSGGVLTACVSTIVSTLCARILPRRRAIVVLESAAWLTATCFGLALLLGGGASDFDHILAQARSDGVGWRLRLLLWLPGGWVGQAFTGVLENDPLRAAGAGALLVLSAAGALLLAEACGAALYRGGWSAREATVQSTRVYASALPRWARGGLGAFIRKDWLLARRTPAMTLGLLGFVVYFLMSALAQPHGGSVRSIVPRMAAAWVGYDVGTRALALDRLAFWRLRVAPLAGRAVALAKLLIVLATAMPFSALGGTAFALLRGMAPAQVVVVAVGCALMSAVGGSLGLLVGSFFTNFSWTRRGAMLRMRGQWLLLPVLALVVVLDLMATRLLPPTPLATLGPVLVAAAACAAFVLPIVARRIERIEWSRAE